MTNRPEGIFGAPLLISTTTGRVLQNNEPGIGPTTNAFFVWVGFQALVVSQGVSEGNLAEVSRTLRESLHDNESTPIVFAMGKGPHEGSFTVRLDNPSGASRRDLARAEAYVCVQAGWYENERITIVTEDGVHAFRVVLAAKGAPIIETIDK